MVRTRQQRLADRIRDVVATCFQGGVLQDPRLTSVTITDARISKDYQIASIYYRVYLDANKDEAAAGMQSASSLLRRRLAEELDLRRAPALRFFYDDGPEKRSTIEDLLKNI